MATVPPAGHSYRICLSETNSLSPNATVAPSFLLSPLVRKPTMVNSSSTSSLPRLQLTQGGGDWCQQKYGKNGASGPRVTVSGGRRLRRGRQLYRMAEAIGWSEAPYLPNYSFAFNCTCASQNSWLVNHRAIFSSPCPRS